MLRSVTTVTFFSVATRVLSFVFKIYMSRALGAETVGLYQICISVLVLLFAVACGGLPTVLSRKIAEAEVRGDTKRQAALMSSSLVIGFVLSAIILIVFYSAQKYLPFIFENDRCVGMFLIMLPTVLTSTFYAVVRAWFWGRKRFLAFSFTEFLDNILKIVFFAVFISGAAAGISGQTGIAIAFTIADALCVIVLFALFFKNGGRLKKPVEIKPLVKSSAPITSMHITGSFVNSLTAIIIPAQLVAIGMTSAEATATFGRIAGMALPLLIAPTTITGALAVVLTPEMAAYAAKDDKAALVNKLQTSIIFCIFVSSLFLVLYAPLGKNIGYMFFGDKIAGEYVSQCCALMFPIALNQVTAPIVNAMGMESKCFKHYLIGIAVLIPCLLLLPRFIGIYAMAVGSGLSLLTSALLNILTLKKKLGKPLFVVKKSALIILFSAPATLLTYFLKGILSHYISSVFVVIICALIGCAVFLFLVWAFKLIRFDSLFLGRGGFFKKRKALFSPCRKPLFERTK
jgi:stage V sporulation protein B